MFPSTTHQLLQPTRENIQVVVGEDLVHPTVCLPYRFAVRSIGAEPWRLAWSPLYPARAMVAWVMNARPLVVHVGECHDVALFATWLLAHAGAHVAHAPVWVRVGAAQTQASVRAWSQAFGAAWAAKHGELNYSS
jgi:hypothetical protein